MCKIVGCHGFDREYIDTISVIIPIYNGEKYINRCIESIVKQTYKNLEIILINDGSTDSSEAICTKWEKKDCRICMINQNNQGVSEARNTGLKKASGKYVLFVDIDDSCELNMLERLHSVIVKDGVDIAICGFKKIDGEISEEKFGKVINNGHLREALFELNEKEFDCGLWNKLITRKIFWNNNVKILFDNNYAVGEDYVWLLHVLKYCNNFSTVNECLYNYYVVNDSASHSLSLDNRNFSHLTALEEASKIAKVMCCNQYNDPLNRLYSQARILELLAYVYKDTSYIRKVRGIIKENSAAMYWFNNRENSIISKFKQILMIITYKLRLNGCISLYIYNFGRKNKIVKKEKL